MQRDYRRGCQVIGSTGTIYWDIAEPHVVVRREGGVVENHPGPEGWVLNQMYLDEMQHFLDCVAGRRPTTAPLEDGAAALEIALAARTRSQASTRDLAPGVPA